MSAMLSIFLDSALRWMLPSILAGLLLLRFGPQKRWKRTAGFLLLATPLAWPVLGVFFYDDADSRGDCLLSLWPLLLALTILHLILQLRQGLTAHLASALMVLAAIYGTLLSQQIWGSTYSLWPFFLLLAADLLMALRRWPGSDPRLPLALAAVMALVLLISGGLYTVSEERLSYIDIPDGPVQHATHPALRGLSSPGPYIGEFEELLDYAAHNIPAADGILILPGEDPFYYATGRRPQFPVLLFDPATDPLSPTETAQVARRRSIRWLILKTHLQIRDDVTPSRTQTLAALLPDYRLVRRLRGYEVYQRATTKY